MEFHPAYFILAAVAAAALASIVAAAMGKKSPQKLILTIGAVGLAGLFLS
jgi:hypothetical protein